jgi:hypothetical protein
MPKYTYKKTAEERKIAITKDENCACWNTGLVTGNQESIYMFLTKNLLPNIPSYWHFDKFIRNGVHELNIFEGNLPEMCHYFNDPSVLIYDPKLELRINVEHIIVDNFDRFPLELRTLLGIFGIQNLTKGALDTVKERVKRNYKTAVPQYYNGSMQLLLPLCLINPARADVALVVERLADCYRASTILPLRWAYNNARQIAKPDKEWLIP